MGRENLSSNKMIFKSSLYLGPNNLIPDVAKFTKNFCVFGYIWLSISTAWQHHMEIELSDWLIPFFPNFIGDQVIWALV